jgi:hypothetical protein
MKINEVVNEVGMWKSFGKGIARAIAPQTVQTYDRQKNALRIDPSMANVASSTSNVATNISQVSGTPTPTATSVDINKIQAAPKPGLPTPAEQAKLQQAIQAQIKGQR